MLVHALDLPGVVFSLVAYGCQATLIVAAARPALRGGRGWAGTFGWSPPRRGDVRSIVLWLVVVLLAQRLVAVVLLVAIPALRHQDTSNLRLDGLSVGELVVGAVVVVAIAPPIEELLFRGLLLRAAMRRMSFVPSALLTSVIFGLGHAYEESTAAGALLITLSMIAFSYLQCMLVRRTGRLGPAIMVHASMNAIGFAIALATA